MLTLTTPLGDVGLLPVGFTCREAISQLFDLRIDLTAPSGAAVPFDRLLGQPVTLGVELVDGSQRYFNGIARRVGEGDTNQIASNERRTDYRLEVVPKLWLLTRVARSRIFQQKSVPDILRAVLEGVNASFELGGTYQPRDYCVQYRETDFDFASRLMEEEGIFYYFKHADGSHTLVVADLPETRPSLAPTSTVHYETQVGGLRPEDRVFRWERSQALTSAKVTLWDHTFELPSASLEASAPLPAAVTAGTVTHKLRLAANGEAEWYDYPGDYAKRFDGTDPGGGDRSSDVQKVFQDNTRTAKVRAQQVEGEAILIRGESNCRAFASGYQFTLADHPNANGAYVLVSVDHEGRVGDNVYENRFTCVPAGLAYRPPRTTPRPVVRGCQTAVVVGSSGEEIATDRYGRVKVQFHWDRDGKKDLDSSCWVRVASGWAGRQWGAVHIPRVGQEVVVDFLEGDPDRPLIVGSVYNADNMPPYALPTNKTQSGLKSRSTLNGAADNFNELRFEDKKGEEHVYLQAEKDLQVKVKNDETRDVLHDRTTTVKNNDTRTVSEGNDVHTVKQGKQTVEVSQGDQEITVALGKQTVTVNGNQSLTVKQGNRTATVEMGNDELAVKMGNLTVGVSLGNISIKADVGSITIEALQGITLKSGPMSSIQVTPEGITAKGVMVSVEGQATAALKGAMVNVEGEAMAGLKGAMVNVQGEGMAQVTGSGMLQLGGGVLMIG